MKKTLIYTLVALAIVATTQVANAQAASLDDLNGALGFDNTVNDVPEAPIHFLVGLGMLAGSYLGFRKLK